MDAMIETNPAVPAISKPPYVATEADVRAAAAQAEKQSKPTPSNPLAAQLVATAVATAEQLAAQKKARRAQYFGIRPGTKGKGTPEAFADDERPPVFHFEYLTATEKQEFYDLFTDDNGRMSRKDTEAAERWIMDRKSLPWEHFTTAKGAEIPYERTEDGKRLTDACWASIPIPLRADLMSMILSANEVSQGETQGVKP